MSVSKQVTLYLVLCNNYSCLIAVRSNLLPPLPNQTFDLSFLGIEEPAIRVSLKRIKPISSVRTGADYAPVILRGLKIGAKNSKSPGFL
ncbi:hypothetical protein I79_006388 [Cricetulus griseus]|uniref:Uncharacterized protein n=1 Tax=Cricetulus griseus TaxID=10029 RepID=G3H7Q2_CRIGR|nr:hypothetical protein I79_006388 [Cricetulus griseus]